MLFTSQSVLLALSASFSLVRTQPHGQPHGRVHQHGAAVKRQTSGGLKGRGIVYADGNTGMGALAGSLQWSTDWTLWQDNPTNADLGTFVHQAWGLDDPSGDPKKQFLSAFLKEASSFPAGTTNLLFNEPDMIDQSWMTPQEAINQWSAINNLKNAPTNAKICTPCVSNGANNGTSGVGKATAQFKSGIDQGQFWLAEFLQLASGQKYEFDCLCAHWYGGPGNSLEADQGLIDQQVKELASLADTYGIKGIVISEMGRLNPAQECEFVQWFQNTFLTDAQYAASGNKITAYAYNYNLFTLTNGDALTPVGSAYIGKGSC